MIDDPGWNTMNTKFACIISVLLLTFFTSISHSQSRQEPEIIAAPDNGVELGLGWDSATGQVVPNRCIEFAAVEERGQSISLDFQEVSSTEELMESLDVSASISVNTMFSSVSAQAKFAKNAEMNSEKTSILMEADVQNGVLSQVQFIRSKYTT